MIAKVRCDHVAKAGAHPPSKRGPGNPRQELEYSSVVLMFLDFPNQRLRYEKKGGIIALHLGKVVQQSGVGGVQRTSARPLLCPPPRRSWGLRVVHVLAPPQHRLAAPLGKSPPKEGSWAAMATQSPSVA
jgi:hypothetical protein